ncbi:hypothetical protein Noda2021_04160 [Candidatus Dependentiae bacterium Noda2021]|nr:hypothetical protein Noda2021_04160 [Candidatus Dependentiae bacterium Noda2021]
MLHQQLIKPQSPVQRCIIMDYWRDKAGVLFMRCDTSDLNTPTILERFEHKYAQLHEIQKYDDHAQILEISHDKTKCLYYHTVSRCIALSDLKSSSPIRLFSADDAFMSRDGTKLVCIRYADIDIYDLTTLPPVPNSINPMRSFPGGKVYASLDRSKLLCTSHYDKNIYDLNNDSLLHTSKISGGYDMLNALISSDNTKAVYCTITHSGINIWDQNTGKFLLTIKEYINNEKDVVLTSDNKLIFASGNSVKVYDLHTRALLHKLVGHTGTITRVGLSHDETHIISSCNDKTIKIWDLYSGACLQTLAGHREWIQNVAITKDNTKIISSGYGESIKVWDFKTGHYLYTITFPKFSDFRFTLSTDNTKIICHTFENCSPYDNTLQMWDLNSGKLIQSIKTNSKYELKPIVHNNLVACGNCVYQLDNWQSIINAMPQSQPACTINNPEIFVDIKQVGPASYVLITNALRQQMNRLKPRSLFSKLGALYVTCKTLLVNTFKHSERN